MGGGEKRSGGGAKDECEEEENIKGEGIKNKGRRKKIEGGGELCR